jgi:hypothetical protein
MEMMSDKEMEAIFVTLVTTVKSIIRNDCDDD